MELEAESKAHRTWTPVLPVPEESVAVATFQWRRLPLNRKVLLPLLAIAVAIVLGCGALAYGVSAIAPATYGARSEIVYPLNAEISSGSQLRQDRVLSTQLVAIKSRTVLTPVALKYHLAVSTLSHKVVASVLQDSEVIRIEAHDRSQSRAQELVGDVTTQYLKNAAVDTHARVEAHLQSQIDALEQQRSTLTQQLVAASADTSNTALTLQLQAQLSDLNTQISGLQSQLSTAEFNDLSAPHVQQLTQPYTIGKVAPKPLLAAGAGVLAGLMIAAGVVVLLLRRRLKRTPPDPFG